MFAKMDGTESQPEKKRAHRALPNRFRCKVGGEWKALDLFSNAQKALVQRQLDYGKSIDPAHSGMTCMEHTAGNRSELTCEVCNLKKSIDEFSKNSRRNQVYQCMRCVAWIETQEPDVTPAPLETGHVSAEEQGNLVWTQTFNNDADFFAFDIQPQAPITAPESLGLGDLAIPPGLDVQAIINKSVSSNSSMTGSSVSTRSQLPPHLQRGLKNSLAKSSTSNSSKQPSTTGRTISSTKLPPHMRDRFLSLTAFEAPDEASNAQSDDTGSISTATTIREDKEELKKSRCLSFNAWDSEGKQHRGVKSPSTVTDSTSSTISDTTEAGWDNFAPLAASRGAKGKWPKTSECRISQSELKKQSNSIFFNAVAPTRKVDEQKRQTFCEPDDDDDIYDP